MYVYSDFARQVTKEISKNAIALKIFSTGKKLISRSYSLTLELSIRIIYGVPELIVTSVSILATKP